MGLVKKFFKEESGQGLVEYALIIILVAIIVWVIIALLGPWIGDYINDFLQQNPDEVCLYNQNGQLLKVWNNPGNEVFLGAYKGLYILSVTKSEKVIYKKLLMY